MNKKRVGIITMHRVVNYGSFLQSYATQKVIENQGFDCEIIDYLYPNKWHLSLSEIKQSRIKNFVHKLLSPLGLLPIHRKQNKLLASIKKHYKLSTKFYKDAESLRSDPPVYDVYLTGSDQTWNARFTKGDSSFLLAFAPEGAKKISFSSSLASKGIEDEYKNSYKKYLGQYSAIAVRETNGVEVIENLINKTPFVTLDPTLMLDKFQWKELASSVLNKYAYREYILFYMLSYAFDPRPYIYDLLKDLQKSTGLPVISFTKIPESYNINHEYCGDAGIEEYLHLFQSSSYVVTSSFHGTAFAVNFGIPLYSVVKELKGQDDRQASFLHKVGLQQCIVPMGKAFASIDPSYNSELAWNNLNKLRLESLSYLKNNLS